MKKSLRFDIHSTTQLRTSFRSTVRVLSLLAVATTAFPLRAFSEEEGSSPTLPPVIVEADPLEPSILESTDPISVVSRKELVRRGGQSLGEALDTAPGVSTSSFGPGASRPIVRGFAGDRVRVLKNGVGTGDVSQISEDHAVAANPVEATSIEVLRGPETLLYGSSAIGGAVNVIDGSIPEERPESTVSGEVVLQGGDSADNERTGSASVLGDAGPLVFKVSGFHRETASIEIPGFAESEQLRLEEELEELNHDEEHSQEEAELEEEEARDRLPNSQTRTSGATIGASHIFDSGFLGLSFHATVSEYGIPGGGHAHEEEEGHEGENDEEHGEEESEGEPFAEGARIDLELYRVDLRGEVRDLSESIEAVKVKSALSIYEHNEIEESGEVGTNFENDAAEIRVDVVNSFLPWGRGVVGTQWTYEEFSATGEEAYIAPTDSFSPAIFGVQTVPLAEHLDLSLGGRLEYVLRDPESLQEEDFVPFGTSVGTTWDISGDGEYLGAVSVAYTERAPSTAELFSNGAHLARGIFEIGDPSLDKERSWGVDLSVKRTSGAVTFGLTPFWQVFSDFINLEASGESEDDLPVNRYEQIGAQFFGFEAVSTVHLKELVDEAVAGGILSDIAFDLQVDYVEARNRNGGEDIPRIPPLRTIPRIRYEGDSFKGLVEAVFVAEQDEVANFERETDSYALLNVEFEVPVPQAVDGVDLSLFARGSNLTDEEARVHSSFLKDEAPQRGRAFLFGVRSTF